MFDFEFYPTPEKVIEMMISPFVHENKYGEKIFNTEYEILEPSAGKGDILDYIINHFYNYNYRSYFINHISCIEIDPNLQAILREKGYRLIGCDFLNWEPKKSFNLILMNPPFSNGCTHLLHAWNILDDGDIVCLLNEETIKNPYTEERKVLNRIIEDNNGKVEFIGNCFHDAEIKTDVNVAIVRLHKNGKGSKFDFNFENKSHEKKSDFENIMEEENPIARKDLIGNLVLSFEQAREQFINVEKEVVKLARILSNNGGCDFLESCLKPLFSINNNTNSDLIRFNVINSYNNFSDIIRDYFWNYVFTNTKVSELMTSRVKKEFDTFCKTHKELDFTKENIENLFLTLLSSKNDIMSATIEDCFDLLTKYHKENRVYQEGWKTNDAFMINKKFILPDIVRYRDYCLSNYYYNYDRDIHDIDVVMAYLDNKSVENTKTIEISISEACNDGKTYAESDYFKLRWYKKGTCHFEFKYEWMYLKLNVIATDKKNWIPGELKKKYENKINNLRISKS